MTTEAQPKLNTLIPMENPETGERCFVNSWDVPNRTADGWRVLGDVKKHTSMTNAPVDHLTSGNSAPDKPAPVIDVAAERQRIMTILRAAAPAQSALADQLIADGKPAEEAVKVLAADAEARRKPAAKAQAPKAEASQAEPVAAKPAS